MRSRPVESKRGVQHLGTWMMMAMAQQNGLHEAVAACWMRGDGVRIAVDATIAALAIGERCVEGVRRLQTPTATTLLRADRVPTASGVRRRLWKLAEEGGATLVAAMSKPYITAARAQTDAPAVFYVDNHLRPYTGQEVMEPSPWHNVVAARLFWSLPFYRPITVAHRITAPLLALVTDHDEICDGRLQAEAARRAGGTASHYAASHFEIYFGSHFERAVTEMGDFLEGQL
jgi:hypothetical protein